MSCGFQQSCLHGDDCSFSVRNMYKPEITTEHTYYYSQYIYILYMVLGQVDMSIQTCHRYKHTNNVTLL